MMRPMVTRGVIGLALCLAASLAAAAGEPAAREDRQTLPWGVKGGVGFSADPSAFLMGLEGDYAFTREFRAGPLLQIAASDRRLIVAPTANFRFYLPIEDAPAAVERLNPFVQLGLGFAYVDRERRRRHDDEEVGFLMNAGFGFDYMVTDRVGLGSHMLFNVLPRDTAGERFFFSWQVVTASVRF
ncbi:MAG TPA: hypothetical protein PKX48_07845 [Planctomycetota bacterium]|nr:hypothetical protein [Planctomycetota bacterium]OQC21205.1 MAG: hypothetical protein BWX69_01182 [Planctomycetes bacterium ADurb.Bin069]HNR99118.1 hypothetical protein [Planctomycetota bacterium]HNU25845.1 hypothetical protein [Planctomycetota bacterium]HOE29775.1 hypothetical protein [Planctomycetota bacterium]